MLNFDQVLSRLNENIRSNSGVKNVSPGSIARTINESFATHFVENVNNLNIQIVNKLISRATGDDLDAIGKLVGVDRGTANYAVGSVKVYIDSSYGKQLNDLKDILGIDHSENIIIPRGTEVADDFGNQVYTLINDVELSDDPVFTDAMAKSYGSSGRISSGVITMFRDTPPDLAPIMQYLMVTNTLPIDTGSDIETDDNYRFRIVSSFTSNAAGNAISVRLTALSIPGVSDIVIQNYAAGIGTVSLIVLSESPIVSQGLLNAVQTAVLNVVSIGTRVVVEGPTYKAIRMDEVIEFKSTTDVGTKDYVIRQVQMNTINYINNLKLGEEFVYTDVERIILQTSSEIRGIQIIRMGVGDYNRLTGLIDYVVPVIVTNQSVESNQKFVCNTKLCTVCY